MPVSENKILKTNMYSDSHSCHKLPPTSLVSTIIQKGIAGAPIQQLLAEYPQNEEQILGALHQLVLAGQIAFDRSTKMIDVTAHLARLKRIEKDLRDKNHFEILGVSNKAKSSDIKKAYHELAKVFHPDKVAASSGEDIKTLTRDIFARMTVAYETLSNDQAKASYVKELEQGKAEKILHSESLLEEAKALLKAGQAAKALEKLKESMSLRPPTSDLILHFLWARLMTLSQTKDQGQELYDIEQGLGKIPPEERHTAIYYFVKGLFQRFLGDLDMARRNLEHSLSLAPNFVEAQRELNGIKTSAKNKPVDIFKDDLSVVVGSIFKKKR